jgi:hypothetical protein
MRVLPKKTCNALIEKIKKSGAGASPDRLQAIYQEESAAQIIYEPDGPIYSYKGGQIINVETGERASDKVIKDVERRVKLILANEESSEAIKTIKRMRDMK